MSQTLSDRASQRGSGRSASFIWVISGCVAFAALLGAASRVSAFSNPQDFGRYASTDVFSYGVGGGRYYTGSPADAYSCEVCHSHPSNYSFPLVQKGLPLDGYAPRTNYKIELTSPGATDAWIQATNQGNSPVTTMMAEFIAANGESAGMVTFANDAETNNLAFPKVWCTAGATLDPATTDPKRRFGEYGMFIYAQETGSLAEEITLAKSFDTGVSSCTVGRGKDETGEEYERRCILAMRPCGAQSIKFVWRSPDDWVGPIWFSAGFVTTYDRSNAPNDQDFVSVMSVPLNPVIAGTTHETVLDSGCSVGAALGSRSDLSGGAVAAAAWLLGAVLLRSRRRRAQAQTRRLLRRGASLVILLACIGCNDGNGLVTNPSDPVGAYEPSACTKKCRAPLRCRMSAWPDAGTAESAAEARDMGSKTNAVSTLQPAAAGAEGVRKVPSLGTLSVQFGSAQPPTFVSDWVRTCKSMPGCSPHYVVAWIENEKGEYVRSLLQHKGDYIFLSLTNYMALGDDCQVPTETVDVITMGTLEAHGSYMLTWDGLYGSGHSPAKPGLYKIKIEVAIDETNHIDVAEIPFMFGDPAPFTMTYPPAPAHAGATLVYTPNPPITP